MAIALLVSACKSAPPASTAPQKPAGAKPASAPTVSKDIADAVREANEGSGPLWKADPPSSVFGVGIERYRLGDGIVLAYAADPRSGAICVAVWSGTRAPADAASIAGIADLLRPSPGGALMRRLEALGAIVGAGATKDAAYFRATIPSAKPERFAALIDLTAERFSTGAPKKEELAKAIAAARASELQSVGSNVRALLERKMDGRMLDGGGASDTAIADELLDARRAVIAVTGDIPRTAALREIRRAWARLTKSAPRPKSDPRSTPKMGSFQASFETDEPFDTALVAWPIPPAADRDHLGLEAIAHVLSGGDESRLARALIPKIATSVEARAPRTLGAGRFEIFVALRPSVTATKAVSAIDREIRAIGRGETSALDLEAARAALRETFLSDLDRLESRAELIGRSALAGEPTSAIEKRIAAISGLTPPELGRVASKWLSSRARADVVGRTHGETDGAKKPKRGRRR
jgi:predicted Zn-dependent peptidase